MKWYVLELVFELKSPLSVGWYNQGNFSRTRLYIPGRNLWAAAVENMTYLLASRFKIADNCLFEEVGDWLLANTAFSYFFFLDNNNRFFGWPSKCNNFKFWIDTYEGEVKKRLVTSYVSTAIDERLGSAQEETLHEVEVINNCFKNPEEAFNLKGLIVPVRVKGYLFIKNQLTEDFSLQLLQSSSNWLEELVNKGVLFAEMSIGGNRTSGLGKIMLCDGYPRLLDKEEPIFGLYKLCDTNCDRPCLEPCFNGNEFVPVMAHLKKCDKRVRLRGELEALSFFDNRGSNRSSTQGGFTKNSSFKDLFWVPGSLIENADCSPTLVINKDMLWDWATVL